MNESARTLTFVGVAALSVAVAWFVHAGSQPEEPEVFAKVGTEFYPEFTDPTLSGSLKVIDYVEDTAEVQEFTVTFQDGRWRIPTHHGYPADAEKHLEKAAASLIGITRRSLAGRRTGSHERFGVIDPLNEDPAELEGLGQRIVLKDKNGNVLADYILGKRVAGQENMYFVRHPEEDETYRAEINLDVSTKFSDWIEQDLLKLNRDDLLSMELKTPEFELVQTPFGRTKRPVSKKSLRVFRKETGPGTEWKIADLNAETKEIDTSGVTSIQTALDKLELNGVRPKPQGLTPNLTLDFDEFPSDQDRNSHFRSLIQELGSRGFILGPPESEGAGEKYRLYGDGGEMVTQSNEGLVYHLHFGKAFSGTETEIEVGQTGVADKEGEDVAEEKAGKDPENGDSKSSLNRYLFIRVQFDKSLLGDEPTKPEEPKKPEGLKDESADSDGSKEKSNKKDNKEKTPEEIKQDKLRKDYESKLALYKNEKAKYEQDLKDYEERLETGKAKTKRLNDRFGNWYYVIPATSYENLTFTRDDVVKKKEEDKKKAGPQRRPSTPTPGGSTSPIEDFIRKKAGSLPAAPGNQPAGDEDEGQPGAKDKTQPAAAEKPAAKTDGSTPQN